MRNLPRFAAIALLGIVALASLGQSSSDVSSEGAAPVTDASRTGIGEPAKDADRPWPAHLLRRPGAVSQSGNSQSASRCAENGSCLGDSSPAGGSTRTIYVRGYYRADGSYVKGHYRTAVRRAAPEPADAAKAD